MILRFKLIIFLFATAIPSFCQAQPGMQIAEQDAEASANSFHREYLEQYVGFPLAEDSRLELYDTIVNWLGTPYRFAGNCDKGIDCSGLVHLLCSRVYGFNPGARNSGELYQRVEKIDPDDLREGDLLFFRIYKRRISHVAMYLGNGKFVHSSTSRGVIISDLNEAYYRKHFAGAGRFQSSLTGIPDTD
jgi:lipoprotein Spr